MRIEETLFDIEVREKVRALLPDLEPKHVKVEIFQCKQCARVRTMGELVRDNVILCPHCRERKCTIPAKITEDDIISLLLRPVEGVDSWEETVRINHEEIVFGWDQNLHIVYDQTGHKQDD